MIHLKLKYVKYIYNDILFSFKPQIIWIKYNRLEVSS